MGNIGIVLSGGVSATMDYTVFWLVKVLAPLGYNIYGFVNGWKGLMDGEYIVLSEDVLWKNRSIMTSCTKINVFDYKGGNYANECKAVYDTMNLDIIFAIGGDGTIRQANALSEFGLKFIHIPATMDRDIIGCDDATGGFYTAVSQAAEGIVAMARDSYKMCRTAIIEIMGRNSGAVAMYAVAKASKDVEVDFLLVPDKKYSLSKIAKTMRKKGRPLVIVIAEGISDFDNTVSTKDTKVGVHVSLSGIGERMATKLSSITEMPVKALTCDYRLRSAQPVEEDIRLVENFANMAIEYMQKGRVNFSTVKNHDYHVLPLYQMAILNPLSDGGKEVRKEDHIWETLKGIDYGEE